MLLSKYQRQVADDPARFKVVVAGRRFGKTFLAMRELCYRAKEPDQNIFYVTTSFRAAKMIMWKPLKHKLLALRWVKKINESELSITLKNGTTISLKGSEDPDRLRGVSLSYVVIDEAAECKLSHLWGEVLRPALSDQQGYALFIGTPKGKSNPFYDLYVKAETAVGWSRYSFTTLDGGRVTTDEIEAAKNDMTVSQFSQEYMASFESTASQVAWAFTHDNNVVDGLVDYDDKIIHVGMDFNVNPMTAAILIKGENDTLVQVDEIRVYGSNTDELCGEIKHRYPRSKVFVYPDPSGSRRQSSSNGNSDHKILENAGFIVKAPRKHDPVRDRINAFNARLTNANGVHRLFVSRNCKYTIECLDKHSFKPGTTIPDKETGFDHMFDAISYAVAYLYPIKKTTTAQPTQQRWGHSIA